MIFGFSEFKEHNKAKLKLKSTLNKPILTNKHLAYLLTEQFEGQTKQAKLGRVHNDGGQTKGQSYYLGRRGVERCKAKAVGPTGSVTNHQ